MTLSLVIVFWLWLGVAMAYGAWGRDPAGNPYKWLIGWPLALIMCLAGLLYVIAMLPVRVWKALQNTSRSGR